MVETKSYLDAREDFVWDRLANYNFVRDSFSDWAMAQPDAVALFWTDSDGAQVTRSYKDLLDDAGKAAAVLQSQGVKKGDTVLIILSRELCWWEIVLGCLQIGAVISPGTVQLTEKDVAYRLKAADASCVITAGALTNCVDSAAKAVGWGGIRLCIDATDAPGWAQYLDMKPNMPPLRAYADTAAADPALCYFTSGTTGHPKMTIHRHDYPLGHKATGEFWLTARPGDLIWNLSDTGWAKAAWSSLFAPWICGAGVFAFHGGAFDADQMLDWLERFPATTVCAPPTIYRILVQKDLSARKFPNLKRCVSAGEPLNPEIIDLWREKTGLQIYEAYGQTETILLCGNFDNMKVKPGSMGLPAPGVNLQVIDNEGNVLGPDEEGDIAVNISAGEAPVGMFSGYKDDPERTARVFCGEWYLTGDRATRDEDGYFWFIGRSDDVILSSGYRIGPFEIESALIEHDAIAESAVVSSPDDTRGEVVKAFVVLAPGYSGSDRLAQEIQAFVKELTAPYKYPRKIEFVTDLPKTISGKIKRKELKKREWKQQNCAVPTKN